MVGAADRGRDGERERSGVRLHGRPHLNAPIVGIAATPTGRGYFEVAADGGVFSFTAPFFGSEGASPLPVPVSGLVVAATGDGYTIVDRSGTGVTFGT